MEILYERCAGLDVHSQRILACASVPDGRGGRRRETRTFGTMTKDLLALADWLGAHGCTHVAMESTGVYWKPVFNILEANFEIVLVNARHVRMVPGRKTDVKDCEWLAQLLEHGLLRASFIPPAPIRELRELTRYRKRLIEERASEANRVQKVLESANLKLGDVASDILGVSGRAILKALAAGQTDPEQLASLARGALQKKHDALVAALTGRITTHHQFLLGQILQHIEYLDGAVGSLDVHIEEHTRPFAMAIEQVDSISGLGRRSAENVLAEIGTSLTNFRTAANLASWACLCPGNNESAGKRLSGRTRMGSRWLRATLVECAWSAIRRRGSFLAGLYWRIKARRGGKKAVIAVAHRMLVTIYHLLTRGTFYEERGAVVADQRARERMARYHTRKLRELGFGPEAVPA